MDEKYDNWPEDKLTPVTDEKKWADLWKEALEWAHKEGLIPEPKK